MKILGIETSCDETAIAIVSDDKKIHSNVVLSQIKEHQPYGGVVPEIAARAHIDKIEPLISRAMAEAKVKGFSQLDAIAVTAGPGLIGGVIVGVMVAKAIASVMKLPIIPVNHLEGHALTVRLTSEVEFPFLLFLVSGGHCQILAVEGVSKYKKLGSSLDDALGEAYDKIAKMMDLGYPGGPIVEKLAKDGDSDRFKFPRSMVGRAGCDFSFSGLKTAVKKEIDKFSKMSQQDKSDICASFQKCAANIIKDRVSNAINMYKKDHDNNMLVVSGGVAANKYIRSALEEVTNQNNFSFSAPPINLCTDNGAMIAWAGIEKFKLGMVGDVSFKPRARWGLEG